MIEVMLSKIFSAVDTAQFPNQNKLRVFIFKPLSDPYVITKFKDETSASSSVSLCYP